MKVGIFGGSFDPIHKGHVRLAKYVLDHTDIDEVWLMVSPRNPLKDHGPIATDQQRLDMARIAVEGIPGIRVSDFEFHLPIPSYTYNTLTELKKAYPDTDFRLIIGGDNWAAFDRWRHPQEILTQFGLIIYPRPGETLEDPTFGSSLTDADSLKENLKENVVILRDAPEMPISSTAIRHLLAPNNSSFLINNSSLEESLNKDVLTYIEDNKIYET